MDVSVYPVPHSGPVQADGEHPWAVRIFRHLALLLGLCFLYGCSSQPSTALRVGINAWPGYEFLYLAQEKGFYRDEGVEVRLVEFGSLSDCRRAYQRGQIDAMGSNVVDVLQVRDQCSRSPQIVRVVDYSNGADVILAGPGLSDAADWRGARIGVEGSSLGTYLLTRGLLKNGLAMADIRVVYMDQQSMEDALHDGELDAAVTYPPTSVLLLRDPKFHPVFSSANIAGEVLDVIAVESQVNAQRPRDVARLLHAFDRAVAYSQANPADAYRIMAEREGITPEEFEKTLRGGIQLLPHSDQAAYFQVDGKLAITIGTLDRILRQSGQIKGPDRHADALNPSYALKQVRP